MSTNRSTVPRPATASIRLGEPTLEASTPPSVLSTCVSARPPATHASTSAAQPAGSTQSAITGVTLSPSAPSSAAAAWLRQPTLRAATGA